MITLNLIEILKDCPRGTKLYSPLFGEVTFVGINEDMYYPIIVKTRSGDEETFTVDGRFDVNYYNETECLLFPSMNCRDWSQFRKPEPEPKPAPVFKPFDRVLVRDSDTDRWRIGFFDYDGGDVNYRFNVIGRTNSKYRYCIPYEGNEELLGTTGKPKE